MALRAKWTLRLEGVETKLAVGPPGKARQLRPVKVCLVINGLTPDVPVETADCLDHASICDWIVRQWPNSAPTPLLETRVIELLDFLFEFDKRVQDASVVLYETGPADGQMRVGVERQVSRSQYQARLRTRRG
ncbi:hypothetical protein [Piscinibacter defluvii]|uniref:hypothetical protein n=1 Tax=Piscinibacter defluvii TaxID=1796922 RepID=UPI000FDE702D|nr:hypothetical protein [Piscinibacter defluvii]